MDLMDSQTLLGIGLVLVFGLGGGVFAATEIALVSFRESRRSPLGGHPARPDHRSRSHA